MGERVLAGEIKILNPTPVLFGGKTESRDTAGSGVTREEGGSEGRGSATSQGARLELRELDAAGGTPAGPSTQSGTPPAPKLFWLPELREQFLPLEAAQLWSLVTAAPGQYTEAHAPCGHVYPALPGPPSLSQCGREGSETGPGPKQTQASGLLNPAWPGFPSLEGLGPPPTITLREQGDASGHRTPQQKKPTALSVPLGASEHLFEAADLTS